MNTDPKEIANHLAATTGGEIRVTGDTVDDEGVRRAEIDIRLKRPVEQINLTFDIEGTGEQGGG